MPRLKSGLIMATTALMVAALSAPAFAGDIHNDVPEKVDPAKHYLIYLHGGWPEIRPITDPHPKHGLFDYEGVLAGLAKLPELNFVNMAGCGTGNFRKSYDLPSWPTTRPGYRGACCASMARRIPSRAHVKRRQSWQRG
jgi:hypothetical protein